MARPNPLTWLPLLDRALEVEIGIAFKITGIERGHFRQNLYEARKQSADRKYDALIIFLPAGDHTDEIWVCKKEVSIDDR